MNAQHNNKIAILFCGQVRTGIKCHPNISRFLSSCVDLADIFIHTWDIDTISHHGLYGRDSGLLEQRISVTADTLATIKDLYKPVEMQVSEFDDFYNNKLYNRIPWLYSFIQVNQMRKRYEQDRYNSFKYRAVLKIRFDLLFQQHHTLNNEVMYMGGNDKLYTCDIWNRLPDNVEDVAWLSSGDTMDLMEEWAHERLQTTNITERHHLDWQQHCALFLQDRNIQTHAWQYNKITVYRDVHEYAHIDIDDFDAIETMDTRQ